MKENVLKDILHRDFNLEEIWKPMFAMLFSKVQCFSNPSNPFSENAKVVSGKQTGVVKLDDGKLRRDSSHLYSFAKYRWFEQGELLQHCNTGDNSSDISNPFLCQTLSF